MLPQPQEGIYTWLTASKGGVGCKDEDVLLLRVVVVTTGANGKNLMIICPFHRLSKRSTDKTRAMLVMREALHPAYGVRLRVLIYWLRLLPRQDIQKL